MIRDVPYESGHHPATSALRRRDLQTKSVLEYLKANFQRTITLDEVAAHIGVSRFRASHLIRESTGRSMQENLNLIRTGYAVDLLLKTEDRLIDIAMASGFSDPKYFNQYFRRVFGVTPRQIRQKPNWRQAILSHFGNDGLDPAFASKLLEAYLG
jgi:AraC-like DNA-binding protein